MVRKVFARDVKTGATVNTVFRVGDKERHTAKSGKVFLSMTLFDKTGRLDARIFENVEAAEGAFQDGDYLLVSGKVTLFHGKPQLMVERLEKLDPGPMDEKEFAPPPPQEREPKAADSKSERGERMSKQTRQRLLNLLDDPAVASGVEALIKHLERYIDERVDQRLGKGEAPRPPKPAREERERDRDRDREREREREKKPEPHKSGLPKDLAFKPFNALAGESQAPSEPSETPSENSPPNPTAG